MSKFILGIVLTLFVISYNVEVKRFFVETGIRNEIVTYFKSWQGYPNPTFDLGIPISILFS